MSVRLPMRGLDVKSSRVKTEEKALFSNCALSESDTNSPLRLVRAISGWLRGLRTRQKRLGLFMRREGRSFPKKLRLVVFSRIGMLFRIDGSVSTIPIDDFCRRFYRAVFSYC